MGYSSTIANELLVTPFDDKSVVSPEISKKLTAEEFCSYCYCHPKFEQDPKNLMVEDDSNEDNDTLEKYDLIKNEVHQQSLSFHNFEEWLNNFDYNKIYTINGNAGTGKTTFINYKKCTDTEKKWVVLDIHLARCYDEWISDIRTDISHFEQAHSKVYGCVMNKIWELVFQGSDQNEEYSIQLVYNNLEKISNNYRTRFAKYFPSGRKLFDELHDVLKTDNDIVIKVEESAKVFQKFIDGKIDINNDAIINILNILLLILRCLFENDEKYIIVFDNFERFIAEDELYNKDVDKIRLLLTSYISRINQKGNCHKSHFKFVMAVRDSTARMCGVKLHASDAVPNNLDLGTWYDTQDIISLKKDWYIKNKIRIHNSEIVEKITGDLRVCSRQNLTGLKLFIDPLFNYNKRLIIDFVGSMVELPSNEKYIKLYMDLWNEDTAISRFAARSVVRGLILKELEEKPDKLFEHLKTYSTKHSKNGIGDARKILTILFNNIQNGNGNEMPLGTVLSDLFNVSDIESIWNNNEYVKKRKSISEILYYMNSYNRRENDWIQLIDLQFKNSECNLIVEDEEKLDQILSDNMKNCVIHLMPAGKAYLMYIVASFEFFALRYSKKYIPLFALIPTPEDIVKYNFVREVPCIKMIECVTKYAIPCVKILKKGEDSIRLHISNSNIGKFHYTRIINQHKSYIETFGTYIYNKYCLSTNLDNTTKSKYQDLYNEICRLVKCYHFGNEVE